MILLVVDAQRGIMNDALHGYRQLITRVQTLITKARETGTEVVYVRHDDGAGTALTPGSEGFSIWEGFQPTRSERIFDKRVNSAFRNSGLLAYLREKGESTVMIVGLQTDYCIDATIKAGFEHGLRMVVPEGTNSTFDNPFMTAEATYRYYNEFLWPRRYAECIPFEAALALMNE